MFSRRLIQLASASLLLVVGVRSEELNLWPFFVRQPASPTSIESWQAMGPLFFGREGEPRQSGLRPIYHRTVAGDTTEGSFLYPFFTWRQLPDFTSFSFFQLVNYRTHVDEPGAPVDQHFDVWPFYFSRKSDDPSESYRAVFPLGGTIKHRFGKDRIDFALFPLYARTLKAGKQTVHAPWPFLRFISGEGHHGFEFWPLAGRTARAGDYDRQFYLWPLIYKSVTNLSEPQPDVKIGVLPFYARDTGPGYISETYAWPFFGYTDRTAPYRYHEQRYFWPLLVQAHGDNRVVNRWAPFYSHSNIKGYDKTWYLWPVYRRARWEANDVAQQRDQVLFFVYWSLTQRSLTNPAAAPARKTHLWPLFSAWDNGAGRKQVQVLSPFEVFFPNNDKVRLLWSPLFAVYRYDHQPDESVRHSVLWNAITWRRTPEETEFHLGPLFSKRTDARGGRWSVGHGLFGARRDAVTGRWRPFLFDFATPPNTPSTQSTTP